MYLGDKDTIKDGSIFRIHWFELLKMREWSSVNPQPTLIPFVYGSKFHWFCIQGIFTVKKITSVLFKRRNRPLFPKCSSSFIDGKVEESLAFHLNLYQPEIVFLPS